jgi:hypothetical protein
MNKLADGLQPMSLLLFLSPAFAVRCGKPEEWEAPFSTTSSRVWLDRLTVTSKASIAVK